MVKQAVCWLVFNESHRSITSWQISEPPKREDYRSNSNNLAGENDFGAIELDRETYFFKLDYCDLDCRYGSEDPSNPEQTTRVLTIMRADEY